MRQVLRREDAQGPEKGLEKPFEGEGTPFPGGKKGFPPPRPLLPQKPLSGLSASQAVFFCNFRSLVRMSPFRDKCSCVHLMEEAPSKKLWQPPESGRACVLLSAEPPKTACYDSPVFSPLSPSLPFKHGYLRVLTRNVCFCEPTLPLLFAWFTRRLTIPHRLTGKSFWKGGARGGRTVFQKGFPPRKLFHQNKKSPAGTGDDQNHMQGEKSFVARRGAPQGKSIKKDPLAL